MRSDCASGYELSYDCFILEYKNDWAIKADGDFFDNYIRTNESDIVRLDFYFPNASNIVRLQRFQF